VIKYTPINLSEKLSLFTELWRPKIIAELNDYEFKLVKLQGEFVWHSHPETDEAFLVVEGSLRIEFRDGSVDLHPGELYIVPIGIEHKPYAEHECSVLIIEPRGIVNTGQADGELTAPQGVKI